MNLVEQFEKCHSFLKKWNDFLELEPIRKYPTFCPDTIVPWIDELETKSISELVNLENHFEIETAYPEFENLLLEIKSLIDFPIQPTDHSFKLICNKVRKKKEHEIKQISSLINPLDGINLIDIGSGAAHLSENLIQSRNRYSYCIDRNASFQAAGKKRIELNNPLNSQKIEFKNMSFDENAASFTKVHNQSLVLGLHACGDLSSDIIQYFEKEKLENLVVIGCCYQHLSTKYNLSQLAQKKGLALTSNAFNLAARSYTLGDIVSLERKVKIRIYRFMLHCYLYTLGHNEFIPTGKTRLPDYEKSFGEYAKIYAPHLISSQSEAQAFYDNPAHLKMVNRIIRTDIFRGLFGRVIEVYIALDRALYLQENGYQVEVKEIFERSLSPRNLAIVVIP